VTKNSTGAVEDVCVLDDPDAIPDGLKPAANGDLYIATVLTGGVNVVGADGTDKGMLKGFGDYVSNVQFRGSTLWTLLFGASYYSFFIVPVLSTWLRYALPLGALLSVFAGLACSRLWSRGVWARALVGIALLYSLGRAVSLDALLLTDTRYNAERWLRENVTSGQVVGYVGPEYYLPRLHQLPSKRLRPTETVLEREKPDFLVVNPDYASRFEPGTREHQLFSRLASGRTPYGLGYSLGPREGSPRWSLLDFESVLANMSKISPPIEIYQRAE